MSGQPPVFLQPSFVIIIITMVIMYLLVIRPQQKKQKEHETMIAGVEKNDEVITSGGIHATVVAVGDKTATLRIADNVRIEVEKTAILQVTKSRSGA
jgi:preprotein translocase subunit YajC